MRFARFGICDSAIGHSRYAPCATIGRVRVYHGLVVQRKLYRHLRFLRRIEVEYRFFHRRLPRVFWWSGRIIRGCVFWHKYGLSGVVIGVVYLFLPPKVVAQLVFALEFAASILIHRHKFV